MKKIFLFSGIIGVFLMILTPVDVSAREIALSESFCGQSVDDALIPTPTPGDSIRLNSIVTNPETTTTTKTTNQNSLTSQEVLPQELTPTYTPQDTTALESFTVVTEVVQNLNEIAAQVEDPAVSTEIKTVAVEQVQALDTANQSIDQAQNRSSVVEFIIGPNYSELKNVKTVTQENTTRISKLERAQQKIDDPAIQSDLQAQIDTLEQQNVLLQNQLNEMSSGFSLFGWLSKKIVKF